MTLTSLNSGNRFITTCADTESDSIAVCLEIGHKEVRFSVRLSTCVIEY